MITVDLHCLNEDDLLTLLSGLYEVTGSDEEPLYEYLSDRLQDLREDQMREDFKEAEEAVSRMFEDKEEQESLEKVQETEEEEWESDSRTTIISYHYTINF